MLSPLLGLDDTSKVLIFLADFSLSTLSRLQVLIPIFMGKTCNLTANESIAIHQELSTKSRNGFLADGSSSDVANTYGVGVHTISRIWEWQNGNETHSGSLGAKLCVFDIREMCTALMLPWNLRPCAIKCCCCYQINKTYAGKSYNWKIESALVVILRSPFYTQWTS